MIAGGLAGTYPLHGGNGKVQDRNGAFVWFAHVIEWEFPDFSVDKCFSQLLKMQEIVDRDGKIEGTIHRYLIVAKK